MNHIKDLAKDAVSVIFGLYIGLSPAGLIYLILSPHFGSSVGGWTAFIVEIAALFFITDNHTKGEMATRQILVDEIIEEAAR